MKHLEAALLLLKCSKGTIYTQQYCSEAILKKSQDISIDAFEKKYKAVVTMIILIFFDRMV